ncbi:MAG TPA: hypothetical protein VFE72_00860 [Lysobacter sp.]|nr:hypothetical protein [Lysobacter sp.]
MISSSENTAPPMLPASTAAGVAGRAATCAVVAGRTGKLTARPVVAGASACVRGAGCADVALAASVDDTGAVAVAASLAGTVADVGCDGTDVRAVAGCGCTGCCVVAGCVATGTTSSMAGPMPLISGA